MTSKQKRMQDAVAKLINYMDTYPNQYGYRDFADETLINDVLYGLGIALDERKYQYANGFEEFKKYLRGFLG